jgi:hypothetical protein
MDPVTHFEIPADDMERAKQFYQEAFGWQNMAPDGMEGEYEMALTAEFGDDMKPTEPGRIHGAFYNREEPDAGTLITVEVDSMEDALGRIEDAGGEVVMPKQPVGEWGFYARFRDSEGNLMGLWESATD